MAEYQSVFDRAESQDAHYRAAVIERGIFNRVYGWMSVALALTGGIAYGIAQDPELAKRIAGSQGLFFGIVIVQLLLVMGVSAMIDRISAAVAAGGFIIYAALNGVIFSVLFMVYTQGSIAGTFFATSLTFGGVGLYGLLTKRDLTGIGSFCGMALWGLIVASIVNMFWANSTLYWLTTYAGILIFVGLTAYDTQKIKALAVAAGQGALDEKVAKKYALLGALTLYLDFINLFLLLLRLFGRRR